MFVRITERNESIPMGRREKSGEFCSHGDRDSFKFKASKGVPPGAVTVCLTTRDKKAGHMIVM